MANPAPAHAPDVSSNAPSELVAYAGSEAPHLPVGGYFAILAAFVGIFGSLLSLGAARRRLPRRISTRDIVLAGIATHKLTRILTRDWVTIPLRFAFTHYEGSDGAGEVKETARGEGLRRAMGDLLTCQYCTGPWVASALTTGLVTRPRETRTAVSILAMVTVSDFLHQTYARTKKLAA